MAIVVQKYGGTSVEGHEKVLGVARRVAALKAEGHGVVVVVSARGGTTDSLVAEARLLTAEPAQRELDMLMTAGERISMSLLAIALNSIGCPAVSFTGSQAGIITDTRHTDARILEVRPYRVVRELEAGNVVVVGGFQGVSTNKDVTTLGRGGSDTTAVALAAALDAERCEILSDVDGVYTADPRKAPAARRLDEISYADMGELARFGATVLKEEAVRFAERHGIAVRVGNSIGGGPGTIVLERPSRAEEPVTGISLLPDVDLVIVRDRPLGALIRELSTHQTAVKMIARLGTSTGIALDRCERSESAVEFGADAAVHPAALIAIVGPGAASVPVAATVVGVVADLGRQPLAFVSGGRSTVMAVSPETADADLRALHETLL
jgi:aspartate kinase